MTRDWVFLCPGQGSQYVGMGRELHDADALVRELFDEANEILGTDLRAVVFEGPAEELQKTSNTQPAMFLLDVAVARLLERGGVGAAATAGHSLGEYAAVVVAGALAFPDGLRLTRLRGELMHRAGEQRPGTMAAVLGLEAPRVSEVLGEIEGTVVAANLNTPQQIVISGEIAAVEAALQRLLSAGAKRAVRLPVGGAFHSPLMAPAADGLARAIRETEFRRANVPIVANVTGEPVREADEIRDALTRQLTAQVRWSDSMRGLVRDGATRFVEVGAGRALRGMLRQIDRSALARGVESPDELRAFLDEALG